MQVIVRLLVAEAHGVGQFSALLLFDARAGLVTEVLIQIGDDVGELLVDDGPELGADVRAEVVESVDEGTDVALEGPAVVRPLQEANQFLKGVLFDELANIDVVLVVDEGGEDLEVGVGVCHFGAGFHLPPTAVATLVLAHQT